MSKLSNVSCYVTEKISVDNIDISEYITTDNLLQNKRGRVIAEKLPTQKVTKFKKDDILIANIRPYLKKIWQADIDGGASSDVLVVRPNNLIDNNFLYYALTQDSFFEYVMKGSKGTKMPRGDKSQIMNFVIPDLEIGEQIKIGKLLKSIDQKIQINNQINQELEAMPKTLHDYWFVQFDFPDQNGKPYKSSGGKMVYHPELKREIPEGWGVTKVCELQIATGKRDANFGTENGKYDFWTTANSPIKADEFSFEGKAILIAGNGNFYVNFTEGKFEAYQRTYVIQSEDENMLIFMYMACLQSVEKLRKGSNGSIIKYITIGDVNNIASPYNKNVVNEFVRIYSPLIDLISKNKRQNQELTKLRDWLLPMLMNGQVKVE